MAPDFSISQQMVNTLRGGVIAAYDQAAPRDRVAWVAVLPELRTTFTGKICKYQGVYIEVTFDSYLEVERLREGEYDFEPGHYLMVTRFECHDLDTLAEVNAFFGSFVSNSEFVRSGDAVEYPDDFRHVGPRSNLEWLLERRWLVGVILFAQQNHKYVRFSIEESTLIGWVVDVGYFSCKICLGVGNTFRVSFWDLDVSSVRILTRGHFYKPTPRDLLPSLAVLPIWNFEKDLWEWLLAEVQAYADDE